MDKAKLTHLKSWRVCGIFAQSAERIEALTAMVEHIVVGADLTRIVYLHAEGGPVRLPDVYAAFKLQRMSRRYTDFLAAIEAITPETLLVVDDVEHIQRYPISMTRNIINHIASRTRYKIIAGGSLLTGHIYDLYAPFHVLDRRILWANHYWAFKAQHREVSVFNGRTVLSNKDLAYTAKKIRPFIYFALEPDPDNNLQVEFYEAVRNAPVLGRAQDVRDLEL